MHLLFLQNVIDKKSVFKEIIILCQIFAKIKWLLS